MRRVSHAGLPVRNDGAPPMTLNRASTSMLPTQQPAGRGGFFGSGSRGGPGPFPISPAGRGGPTQPGQQPPPGQQTPPRKTSSGSGANGTVGSPQLIRTGQPGGQTQQTPPRKASFGTSGIALPGSIPGGPSGSGSAPIAGLGGYSQRIAVGAGQIAPLGRGGPDAPGLYF